MHKINKHNKCVIRIRILPHLSRRNKTIKSSILMAFSAPFFFLLFLVFNFADFFGCLFLTTVLSPKEKPTGMTWSATGYELVWSEISPVSADLSVNWQSAAAPISKTKPSSARAAQKVGVHLLKNGAPCWTSIDRHCERWWRKGLNEVCEEIHT